jgi:transglutaminase/protease-like cytokinesis protein 3
LILQNFFSLTRWPKGCLIQGVKKLSLNAKVVRNGISVGLVLTLLSSTAFADTVEILVNGLNAHSSGRFQTGDRNVEFALAKGTEGTVLAHRHFASGNVGYQIRIENGPHAGQVVWVLDNRGSVRAGKARSQFLEVYDDQHQPTEKPELAKTTQTLKRTPALPVHSGTPVGTEVVTNQIEHSLEAEPRPSTPQVKKAIQESSESQVSQVSDDSSEQHIPQMPDNYYVVNLVTNQVTRALQQDLNAASGCNNTVRQRPQLTEQEMPFPQPHSCTQTLTGDLSSSTSQADDRAAQQQNADPLGSTPMIQSADPEIIQKAQEVIQGAGTDLEKALKIHDWVAAHVTYDMGAYSQYLENTSNLDSYKTDALTVLHSGSSICSGYSDLYAAMARAVGLPTRIVAGQACTQADGAFKWVEHEWNEVQIDGKWIPIDTTWDSVYFHDGNDQKFPKSYQTHFFNPDLSTFDVDHRTVESEASSPLASTGGSSSSSNL